MVDAEKIIVEILNTNEAGLKVYHENFLDSSTPTPCLSYKLYDSSLKDIPFNKNFLEYDKIIIKIKVWAKSQADLVKYSNMVDNLLRPVGMKRTNTNDLWQDNIGQRELKYSGLTLEYFKEVN